MMKMLSSYWISAFGKKILLFHCVHPKVKIDQWQLHLYLWNKNKKKWTSDKIKVEGTWTMRFKTRKRSLSGLSLIHRQIHSSMSLKYKHAFKAVSNMWCNRPQKCKKVVLRAALGEETWLQRKFVFCIPGWSWISCSRFRRIAKESWNASVP